MNYKEFVESLTDLERPLVAFYADFLKGKGYKRVLEIGSGWGIFARNVLEFTEAELTTVDKIPDLESFEKNTKGFEGRMNRITAPSFQALDHMLANETEPFDLIFIDGAHDYASVLGDLKKSWKLVREGGYIAMDDVFHRANWKPEKGDFEYGVARALFDFCKEHGILSVGCAMVGSGGVMFFQK